MKNFLCTAQPMSKVYFKFDAKKRFRADSFSLPDSNNYKIKLTFLFALTKGRS